MLTTILITITILLICVLLLSVKILLKKNGEFPSSHVGGNKALRDKGIQCARTQHKEILKQRNLEQRLKEIKV